jgi:hypothetical protein
MMGALLRGAGWVVKEGLEGEREGRVLTRSGSEAKDQEETMMMIEREETEDEDQEGGNEERKQGEELAGLFRSLTFGKTDSASTSPGVQSLGLSYLFPPLPPSLFP